MRPHRLCRAVRGQGGVTLLLQLIEMGEVFDQSFAVGVRQVVTFPCINELGGESFGGRFCTEDVLI